MRKSYRQSIIDRAQRLLIKDGYLGGSPLGVLAVDEMLDLARAAAGRRDTMSGVYNPFDLAKRYCGEMTGALRKYETDLRRWMVLPRRERGPKPRRPTPSAIAEKLSPNVPRSVAIDRLNKARHPLMLDYLKLIDPLLASSVRSPTPD